MISVITDPRCTEYSIRGHPERPQRISRTVEHLKEQTALSLEWLDAQFPLDSSVLLRAHAADHLRHLLNPVADFDGDTPAYPHIDAHARRSVAGALKALDLARNGQTALSLLRPPGHHATQKRAMGFCYLNSVAISALHARALNFERVAVFDFDVHHGNGTESILLDEPGCAFYSVHQYPAYPGTGAETIRNASNYPVRPGATREEYRGALTNALEEMQRWKPDIIGVSAGFDAFRGDPLSDEPLEAEDFEWIGRSLRSLGKPLFNVLEGGYSHELPSLIHAYLTGLD